MLPCAIFEDEHLLVVNKPAGMNTHAPAPYAGEGLYEWLRDREGRWANLAIIHRLDKETSGVLVFSKTREANRDLTKQFEGREVKKRYAFLTSGRAASNEFTVKNCLVRGGDKYYPRPLHAGGTVAETLFKRIGEVSIEAKNAFGFKSGAHLLHNPLTMWEAEPKTGRTHQIRAHASVSGIPIVGDTLYEGERAARVYLHATEIAFRHPATGAPVKFTAEPKFETNPRFQLRRALIDNAETDAYRLLNGASDDKPGWYLDQVGEYLLSQSSNELTQAQRMELERLLTAQSFRALYHKILSRSDAGRSSLEAQPKFVMGEPAPARFTMTENGLRFEMSFNEGYSIGLFLDQRDNRRRTLTGNVGSNFSLFAEQAGPREVLNAFSYTCAFSVCAGKTGARVTSLDLSKKYLDWGKRNFELNGLNPKDHDFIYGDVFDWLPRLKKKGRQFDLVMLDPPTFSRSKESGVFRAERDYSKLVSVALPLVKESGVLFCSCNTADWEPLNFIETIRASVKSAGREILQERYYPQPPDFPISREEPAYLKTVWLRIG